MRGAFERQVGGLPAAFWWLWVSTLVSSLGGFVVPFLALWLTGDRGYSPTVAGVVGTAFGLGSVAGALVGGTGADRYGRRPTILLTQLLAAAAVLAMGFATSLAAIVVLALLVGLGTNAARPARTAMMADLVPDRDRVRAFSLTYWAINLGFAVSAVAAGVLADVSYELLFVGNAVALALCALVVAVRVPETRPTVAATPSVVGEPSRLRDVLGDRVFMAFVGLSFAFALILMQYATTLPLAMADSGLTAAQYGVVIALNGVLIVVAQLPLGRAADGFRRSRVLALSSLLVGVGFGLSGVADGMAAYALAVCVWTVGEILNAPLSMAVVAELSAPGMRGRYQGVYNLSWSGASFVAPLGGAWVYDALGPPVLWAGCAVLGAATAVGHLAVAGARTRRLATGSETAVGG